MKMLILTLLSALLLGATPDTTVYVCAGPKVNRYHRSESCRGLSNCQHRILKITLKDAEKSGKTLCQWEK